MPLIDFDAALARWRQTGGGRAVLINLSENHTFRVEGPGGTHILRLHRPGYQSAAAIESELAWLQALRAADAVPVPQPLPGADGALVQELEGRYAVLFALEPGREPTPEDDLVPLFRIVGAYAARTHLHVEHWSRPQGFTRPTWDAGAILDADGLWGDWRSAPKLTAAGRETLAELDERLRTVLAAYGTGGDRFGLIHADMRLANLLVAPGRTTLIDFDDCGFGWFLYDFAASLSFLETSPLVPELRRSWLAGYTAVRPLQQEDLAVIDAMVLLRRMALLAWVGSHSETPLAQEHAPRFAADTVTLAATWLAAPVG
ncbi:MAG TPA: phosphotransferase [Devosiaceae bacterium]|nr:phosphotransferase [Devosiaceae bacterium]